MPRIFIEPLGADVVGSLPDQLDYLACLEVRTDPAEERGQNGRRAKQWRAWVMDLPYRWKKTSSATSPEQ